MEVFFFHLPLPSLLLPFYLDVRFHAPLSSTTPSPVYTVFVQCYTTEFLLLLHWISRMIFVYLVSVDFMSPETDASRTQRSMGTFIRDKLWLGGVEDAYAVDKLKGQGTSHILTVECSVLREVSGMSRCASQIFNPESSSLNH